LVIGNGSSKKTKENACELRVAKLMTNIIVCWLDWWVGWMLGNLRKKKFKY